MKELKNRLIIKDKNRKSWKNYEKSSKVYLVPQMVKKNIELGV